MFSRATPVLIAMAWTLATCAAARAQVDSEAPATHDAPTVAASDVPPPLGSQVSQDENFCAMCHGESELWDENARRLYVSLENLADDVHAQKGVNCHDCHGGDHTSQVVNQAHARENGFRALADVGHVCAKCHQSPSLELIKGVHAKAGAKDERGQGTPLRCDQCHGNVAHHLLPASHAESPVSLANQVATCGKCHERDRASYQESVHGHGYYSAGLTTTASCADCHGKHGIHWAADSRSTLHANNVARTCGKCHKGIAEQLAESVHGPTHGAAGARRAIAGATSTPTPSDETPTAVGEEGAAKAANKRRKPPVCTSCHEGHQRQYSQADRFRLGLPNLCGNCHAEESGSYAMAIHSELSEIGYVPAANCAECHGAHAIQSIQAANSPVSAAHRAETCRQCHPGAPDWLFAFNPHADHRGRRAGSSLHEVYGAFMSVLVVVFGVLGIHALAWFVRSLVDVLQRGRLTPLSPGGIAYRRFSATNRWAYTALVASFLALALTGLPLKYSQHEWAKSLAYGMGGFEAVGAWHRWWALVAIACCLIALGALIRAFVRGRRRGTAWSRLIFGPDSLVFCGRDFRDMLHMLRWIIGLGKKPTFERWGYWEKFDFWGAWVAVAIIGGTGLILWFPQLFSLALPGTVLNVAKVIHSTQALLAVGLLFAIHFFNTHLRAEQFPGDVTVMTGLVGEQRLAAERPEYLQRLRDEGRLEQHRAVAPSRAALRGIRIGGLLATAMGLALLIGTLIAAME